MQTRFRRETGAKQAQLNLPASDVACREKTWGKKRHIQDVCHYFLTQRVFTVKRCFQFPLFFPLHLSIHQSKPASALLLSPSHQPSPNVSLSVTSHDSVNAAFASQIFADWWVCSVKCVWGGAHANGNVLNFPRSSFWETQQQEWMF